MIQYSLYFDNETDRKYRWITEVDGIRFRFYVPKEHVPTPAPHVIRVGINWDEKCHTHGEGNIEVVVEFAKEHSETIRYRPVGNPEQWMVGEPYVPKTALPNPRPQRLLITVSWNWSDVTDEIIKNTGTHMCHRAFCQSARNMWRSAERVPDIESARADGYRPCTNCHPFDRILVDTNMREIHVESCGYAKRLLDVVGSYRLFESISAAWSSGSNRVCSCIREMPGVKKLLSILGSSEVPTTDIESIGGDYTPYEMLREIETCLHDHIRQALEKRFSDDWWQEGIPVCVRKACVVRREEDSEPEDHPYRYTMFVDLKEIVDKQWKIFSGVLPCELAASKPKLLSCLKDLNRIRNKIMHPVKSKTLSDDDHSTIVDFRREVTREWRKQSTKGDNPSM